MFLLIVHIINLSLINGTDPSELRIARIPTLKKKDVMMGCRTHIRWSIGGDYEMN